jgi:hypothetical protein
MISKPFKVHDSITLKRIEEAVDRYNNSLDNPGFCLECGLEQDGCEPDARDYECEHCGAMKVMGAMEIFMCVGGLK